MSFIVRAVFCAAISVTLAWAQETVNHASISGRVTDPSGALVEGAQVAVRHTDTNLTWNLTTDREGRFRFPYLRVGRYEITVSGQGFAAVKRSLTLTVGAAFELPISLSIGAADTTVTVTEEATVLESARSQIAGTVLETEARNLPLNGRNFLDLALLVPGVSPTNTASTQLFAETSAVPGQGISVGSQRNLSNNFIVDGLSANDDAAGLSGIFYGLDVVQEFQVVTSGGQAELGRALGGYMNVVTKSGTNYCSRRPVWLPAQPAFQRNQPAFPQQSFRSLRAQYGASVGGPIVRDRSFYFSNFEQRRLNQSGLVTILPENVNVINARLASVGYQGPAVTTGPLSQPG